MVVSRTEGVAAVRLFAPPDIDELKAKHDVSGLLKALTDYGDKHDRYAAFRRREAAAEALRDLADPVSVDGLLDALRKEEKKDTSLPTWKVAEALGRIGDRRAVPAVVRLVPQMHDQLEPVKALGELGGDEAMAALVDAMRSGNTDTIKHGAAKALGGLGQPAIPYIAPLLDETGPIAALADEALEVAGVPDDPAVRERWARITGRFDQATITANDIDEFVEKKDLQMLAGLLVDAVQHDDLKQERLLAGHLKRLASWYHSKPDVRVPTLLFQALAAAPDWEQAKPIEDVLSELRLTVEEEELLAELVQPGNTDRVQHAAMRRFACFPASTRMLVERLHDPDPQVRARAAAYLRAPLQPGTKERTSTASVDDYYEHGDFENARVGELLGALADDDADVRKAAAYSIEDNFASLARKARLYGTDPRYTRRTQRTYVLGPLQDLVHREQDPAVKRAAEKGLAKVSAECRQLDEFRA
jgi:HEAT repeat protein